jgi:hypothetical protein
MVGRPIRTPAPTRDLRRPLAADQVEVQEHPANPSLCGNRMFGAELSSARVGATLGRPVNAAGWGFFACFFFVFSGFIVFFWFFVSFSFFIIFSYNSNYF